MIPAAPSRHGLTPDEREADSSGRTAHRSSGAKWLRCVSTALILSLVLLMDVLSNVPVVAAANHAPTKLPIPQATYTLQQFLKQGHAYQPKDAPLLSSQSTPAAPRGTTLPKKAVQSLPGAEPPKMKAASQKISASFLQAPAAPASLDPSITGSAGSTPEIDVVGSDADGVRLEVIIVPGSLDLSKATTAKGTAPQVPLTISVTQQQGHFVGMTTSLGTFQVQITDAGGQVVSGITLRSPASFVLHYRKKELQQLDLEPGRLLMTWPALTSSSNAALAKEAVIPMSNDGKPVR